MAVITSFTVRPTSDEAMSSAAELAHYAPGAATLLTLGVFDGVHLGHLSLIETLRRQAAARALIPGIVTFDPHPVDVLHPGETLPLLASMEERVRLLARAGVHLIVPLTFTHEMSRMSPQEFVGLLQQHLRMAGLILGPDFSLGRDREGTVATLQSLGARLGFTVERIAAHTINGRVVSSTAIRAALAEGDVSGAALMLGRRYSLTGPVTTTSQRGASLGFPTANLEVDPRRSLPRNGVYATIATIPDGRFGSVTNIGHRPTFGPTERIVETHILDFRGRIYGAPLTIEFTARLRDEITFETAEDLIAQIHRDVESARGILGEYS
jgi:riboflavin kinase / FMN adenylyltransferase